MTRPHPDPALLVPVLLRSLGEIASNISRARDALQDCDDSNKAAQIADSLAVAGWIADKCLGISGEIQSHGDADDWLLDPGLHSKFAELKEAAS